MFILRRIWATGGRSPRRNDVATPPGVSLEAGNLLHVNDLRNKHVRPAIAVSVAINGLMHAGRAHLQFLLEDQVVKLAAEASKTDSSPALSERAGLSIPIDTINAQWKGHWRHVAARFDYAAGKVELYV